MKTLALLSLCLTVALSVPPAVVNEDQSPLLGDLVPVQGRVVVESPAPQPKLSSKEQQEKTIPVDVKQSQSTAELEVKAEQEVKVKPDVKDEEQFKAEKEVTAEPEPEPEAEAEMQPEGGEEEAIMGDYVSNEEPVVEPEPEMMEESSQNEDVMPDAAFMEEGPALDIMGQQMSLSENYFPNEEAKIGMRKLQKELQMGDAANDTMMEGTERQFRREGESPEQVFEDAAMEDADISEMSVRELRTGDSRVAGKQGQSCCPGVVLDGKCYEFFRGPKKAADAEFFCQDRFPGGHLASITSQYNHRQLMDLMLKQNGAYTRTWIGGLRFFRSGRFIWLDGSRWSYADWLPGEPNNTSDLEDCLEVLSFGNGKFNDFTCWEPQAFICSYPH